MKNTLKTLTSIALLICFNSTMAADVQLTPEVIKEIITSTKQRCEEDDVKNHKICQGIKTVLAGKNTDVSKIQYLKNLLQMKTISPDSIIPALNSKLKQQ